MYGKTILFIVGLIMSTAAYSWSGGAVTGKISGVDVAGGEDHAFRIQFEGNKTFCGTSHTWAFINESDSNYSTYVSVLLSAYHAKNSVTVYGNSVGPHGYCKLGYISLR